MPFYIHVFPEDVLGKADAYGNRTKRAIIEINRKIAESARDYLIEQLSRYSKTGNLSSSVRVQHVTPTDIELRVAAPYALYFFQGTNPSPGRYVPAIEKRLTARGIRRSRKLINRYARRMGVRNPLIYEAIRKTPVRIVPKRALPPEIQGVYQPALEGYRHLIEGIPSPYGNIYVRRGQVKISYAIRHELWHTVQAARGRIKGHTEFLEGEAYEAEERSIFPIGTHPGTPLHMEIINEFEHYITTELPNAIKAAMQ